MCCIVTASTRTAKKLSSIAPKDRNLHTVWEDPTASRAAATLHGGKGSYELGFASETVGRMGGVEGVGERRVGGPLAHHREGGKFSSARTTDVAEHQVGVSGGNDTGLDCVLVEGL